MVKKNVEDFIRSKFLSDVTQRELRSYNSNSINWIDRTRATLDDFLPIASDLATYVCDTVPRRLNSAYKLEELYLKQKNYFLTDQKLSSWIKDFEENLLVNTEIVGSLESQQVSAEIQRQVFNWHGLSSKIFNNGNSIYPDFIFKDRDYSSLPFQSRQTGTVHGPCLQGKKNPKPSNVPDGVELKTNRGKRMRVDAHAPHIGLHLAFTWNFSEIGHVEINGAWLAFITESDHKEATRNSKTTTVKYSFGQDKFISLL